MFGVHVKFRQYSPSLKKRVWSNPYTYLSNVAVEKYNWVIVPQEENYYGIARVMLCVSDPVLKEGIHYRNIVASFSEEELKKYAALFA
jgi:hypothetical protein